MTPGHAHSDEAFAAGFAAGGTAAIEGAFERYGALVHSFCRRIVGTADAADVTQEVFVSAWRAQARFDPSRGSLAGWLLGIARRRSIDHLRRRTRQGRTHIVDIANRVDAITAVAERMALSDALDSLPARQRCVVEAALIDDLTHEQIAVRCGVPLGTVKSDLRRTLPRLAHAIRHVEERGEFDE